MKSAKEPEPGLEKWEGGGPLPPILGAVLGRQAGCSPALVGADGQVSGVGQPRGRVRLMDGASGKVQQITSLRGGKEEGGELTRIASPSSMFYGDTGRVSVLFSRNLS